MTEHSRTAAPGARKRLLAPIHDIHPGSLDAVERLTERFERHSGGPYCAMLAAPGHWGRNAVAGNAGCAVKLRGRAGQGIGMFVHGGFHKDLAGHSRAAALKAKHMTASEGEFPGLSATEAARRMAAGKARAARKRAPRRHAGLLAG